jgi:hypothetical protein
MFILYRSLRRRRLTALAEDYLHLNLLAKHGIHLSKHHNPVSPVLDSPNLYMYIANVATNQTPSLPYVYRKHKQMSLTNTRSVPSM